MRANKAKATKVKPAKYVNPAKYTNPLVKWVNDTPVAAKPKAKPKKVRVSQRQAADWAQTVLSIDKHAERINHLDDEMAKLSAQVRELEDALVNDIGDAVAHAIKQCEYKHHRLSEGVIDEPCSCCHHHVSEHDPINGCLHFTNSTSMGCACKELIKTEAQAPTKGVAKVKDIPAKVGDPVVAVSSGVVAGTEPEAKPVRSIVEVIDAAVCILESALPSGIAAVNELIHQLNDLAYDAGFFAPEIMGTAWRRLDALLSRAVDAGTLPPPNDDAPEWSRDLSNLIEGRLLPAYIKGKYGGKTEPASTRLAELALEKLGRVPPLPPESAPQEKIDAAVEANRHEG